MSFLVASHLRIYHLKIDRPALVYVPGDITADKSLSIALPPRNSVNIMNLWRRASVITVRNCKSVSCGHPFAPARPSEVLYPFEVRQASSVRCSSHKAARFLNVSRTNRRKRFQAELLGAESSARSTAGNRRGVLGSCEK